MTNRWLERLCRRYRCAAGIVGNPHCPVLPVPSRVPLMMAIGKAIPVKKVDPSDPGFAAAVEATHADVVDAVNELYNRHKHTYGWSKRPLEIV